MQVEPEYNEPLARCERKPLPEQIFLEDQQEAADVWWDPINNKMITVADEAMQEYEDVALDTMFGYKAELRKKVILDISAMDKEPKKKSGRRIFDKDSVSTIRLQKKTRFEDTADKPPPRPKSRRSSTLHQVPADQRLPERTIRWFEQQYYISAYVETWIPQTPYQVRGVSLWSINQGAHRVVDIGVDGSSLGRWCWARYQGRNGTILRVFSAY